MPSFIILTPIPLLSTDLDFSLSIKNPTKMLIPEKPSKRTARNPSKMKVHIPENTSIQGKIVVMNM